MIRTWPPHLIFSCTSQCHSMCTWEASWVWNVFDWWSSLTSLQEHLAVFASFLALGCQGSRRKDICCLWETKIHVSTGLRVVHQGCSYVSWCVRYSQGCVFVFSTLLLTNYMIFPGDRVAICSRNYPDFLVAFWACRMSSLFHSKVRPVLPWLPRPHWSCFGVG